MAENIKISINILPFGQIKMMYNSPNEKFEEKEMPVYVEPHSTNVEKIEIVYEKTLKEYKVSETTDGI